MSGQVREEEYQDEPDIDVGEEEMEYDGEELEDPRAELERLQNLARMAQAQLVQELAKKKALEEAAEAENANLMAYQAQAGVPSRETGETEGTMSRTKDLLGAMRTELIKKDKENLALRKQNEELLSELERLANEYLKERSAESDQMAKLKEYETEFKQVQEAMNEKLKEGINFKERQEQMEKEKEKIARALIESTEINKKMKDLLTEKDRIIEKMQSEVEKVLSLKKDFGPLIEENTLLKQNIEEKKKEIELLKDNLTKATSIVSELPNLETFMSQTKDATEKINEENSDLIEKIDKLTEMNTALLKDSETKKETLDLLEKEKEKLETQNQSLITELSKFMGAEKEMRSLLDRFEKALMMMSDENKSIKAKLLKSEAENAELRQGDIQIKDSTVPVPLTNQRITEANSKDEEDEEEAPLQRINEPEEPEPENFEDQETETGRETYDNFSSLKKANQTLLSQNEQLKMIALLAEEREQALKSRLDKNDKLALEKLESILLKKLDSQDALLRKSKDSDLNDEVTIRSLLKKARDTTDSDQIIDYEDEISYDEDISEDYSQDDEYAVPRKSKPAKSSRKDKRTRKNLHAEKRYRTSPSRPTNRHLSGRCRPSSSSRSRSRGGTARSSMAIRSLRTTGDQRPSSEVESFLCSQIKKLNRDLEREKKLREEKINRIVKEIKKGDNPTKTVAFGKSYPIQSSTHTASTKKGKKKTGINAAKAFWVDSNLKALMKAADPEEISLTSRNEAEEVIRVEDSMNRAFKDFESKMGRLKSRIDQY